MGNPCPVCKSPKLSPFLQIKNLPVHFGLLWRSQVAALDCPKGELNLAVCMVCGFITNLAFVPSLMETTRAYENSMHFSPRFQAYARSVASRLVDFYGLRNGLVFEIGCGRGEFLAMVCELGDNQGIGFESNSELEGVEFIYEDRIKIVRDPFPGEYVGVEPNLICCRYLMEHIPNPLEFLHKIRGAISDEAKTVFYFEVPDALFMLRKGSIWSLVYEHCSYFTFGSLASAFSTTGFEVLHLEQSYGGQFLSLEARLAEGLDAVYRDHHERVEQLVRTVDAFSNSYGEKIIAWRRDLERRVEAGRRVVVWGAGAKGVSFLNMLEIRDQIEFVVDINPHKQGAYIAGTGQRIVPPGFLQEYRPDVVIVMNPIYRDEIQNRLQELDLSAETLVA